MLSEMDHNAGIDASQDAGISFHASHVRYTRVLYAKRRVSLLYEILPISLLDTKNPLNS